MGCVLTWSDDCVLPCRRRLLLLMCTRGSIMIFGWWRLSNLRSGVFGMVVCCMMTLLIQLRLGLIAALLLPIRCADWDLRCCGRMSRCGRGRTVCWASRCGCTDGGSQLRWRYTGPCRWTRVLMLLQLFACLRRRACRWLPRVRPFGRPGWVVRLR